MEILLNKDHPAQKFGFKVGVAIKHKESGEGGCIIGYGDCRVVWSKVTRTNTLCRKRCHHIYTVVQVDANGFAGTGYWCMGEEPQGTLWEKVIEVKEIVL